MIPADEWRGASRPPWTAADDDALGMALDDGVTADAVVKGFRLLLRAGDRPERTIREIVQRVRERRPETGPVLLAALEALANREFMPPKAAEPTPPPAPRPPPTLRSMLTPPPITPKAPAMNQPDDEWQTAQQISALINRGPDTIRAWAARGAVKRRPTENPVLTDPQWLYSVRDCRRQVKHSRPSGRLGVKYRPQPVQPEPRIELPPQRPQRGPVLPTALEAHVWAERDAGNITDAQALDMLRALRGGR